MSVDLDTTCHAAGPPVTINGRLIQRCIVCGHKLVDSVDPPGTTKMVPLKGGKLPPLPTWEAFALVRVNGRQQVQVGSFGSEEQKLPKDMCIDLVE